LRSLPPQNDGSVWPLNCNRNMITAIFVSAWQVVLLSPLFIYLLMIYLMIWHLTRSVQEPEVYLNHI
jgi:hypothetical protein